MKKILISTLSCAALAIGSIGCGGDDTDASFIYGNKQEGLGKPEGGELRFERVKVPTFIAPGGAITLVQSYFVESATGDFPLPELGKCNQVAMPDGTPIMWPMGRLQNKVYTDVGPSITLNNGSKTITLNRFTGTEAMPLSENVPSSRKHQILYAGPMQTNMISPDDLVYDTTYEMSYENATKLHHGKVYLPRDYAIRSHPVGTATVSLTKGQDAVFEYDSLAPGVDVVEHDPNRAFPFVIIIDPSKPTFTHVCLAGTTETGKITVPAATLDEAAPKGLILHGQLSHYLDEFKGRRFDILGVSCNLSPYEIK
jgi:hypothetical protein